MPITRTADGAVNESLTRPNKDQGGQLVESCGKLKGKYADLWLESQGTIITPRGKKNSVRIDRQKAPADNTIRNIQAQVGNVSIAGVLLVVEDLGQFGPKDLEAQRAVEAEVSSGLQQSAELKKLVRISGNFP